MGFLLKMNTGFPKSSAGREQQGAFFRVPVIQPPVVPTDANNAPASPASLPENAEDASVEGGNPNEKKTDEAALPETSGDDSSSKKSPVPSPRRSKMTQEPGNIPLGNSEKKSPDVCCSAGFMPIADGEASPQGHLEMLSNSSMAAEDGGSQGADKIPAAFEDEAVKKKDKRFAKLCSFLMKSDHGSGATPDGGSCGGDTFNDPSIISALGECELRPGGFISDDSEDGVRVIAENYQHVKFSTSAESVAPCPDPNQTWAVTNHHVSVWEEGDILHIKTGLPDNQKFKSLLDAVEASHNEQEEREKSDNEEEPPLDEKGLRMWTPKDFEKSFHSRKRREKTRHVSNASGKSSLDEESRICRSMKMAEQVLNKFGKQEVKVKRRSQSTAPNYVTRSEMARLVEDLSGMNLELDKENYRLRKKRICHDVNALMEKLMKVMKNLKNLQKDQEKPKMRDLRRLRHTLVTVKAPDPAGDACPDTSMDVKTDQLGSSQSGKDAEIWNAERRKLCDSSLATINDILDNVGVLVDALKLSPSLWWDYNRAKNERDHAKEELRKVRKQKEILETELTRVKKAVQNFAAAAASCTTMARTENPSSVASSVEIVADRKQSGEFATNGQEIRSNDATAEPNTDATECSPSSTSAPVLDKDIQIMECPPRQAQDEISECTDQTTAFYGHSERALDETAHPKIGLQEDHHEFFSDDFNDYQVADVLLKIREQYEESQLVLRTRVVRLEKELESAMSVIQSMERKDIFPHPKRINDEICSSDVTLSWSANSTQEENLVLATNNDLIKGGGDTTMAMATTKDEDKAKLISVLVDPNLEVHQEFIICTAFTHQQGHLQTDSLPIVNNRELEVVPDVKESLSNMASVQEIQINKDLLVSGSGSPAGEAVLIQPPPIHVTNHHKDHGDIMVDEKVQELQRALEEERSLTQELKKVREFLTAENNRISQDLHALRVELATKPKEDETPLSSKDSVMSNVRDLCERATSISERLHAANDPDEEDDIPSSKESGVLALIPTVEDYPNEVHDHFDTAVIRSAEQFSQLLSPSAEMKFYLETTEDSIRLAIENFTMKAVMRSYFERLQERDREFTEAVSNALLTAIRWRKRAKKLSKYRKGCIDLADRLRSYMVTAEHSAKEIRALRIQNRKLYLKLEDIKSTSTMKDQLRELDQRRSAQKQSQLRIRKTSVGVQSEKSPSSERLAAEKAAENIVQVVSPSSTLSLISSGNSSSSTLKTKIQKLMQRSNQLLVDQKTFPEDHKTSIATESTSGKETVILKIPSAATSIAIQAKIAEMVDKATSFREKDAEPVVNLAERNQEMASTMSKLIERNLALEKALKNIVETPSAGKPAPKQHCIQANQRRASRRFVSPSISNNSLMELRCSPIRQIGGEVGSASSCITSPATPPTVVGSTMSTTAFCCPSSEEKFIDKQQEIADVSELKKQLETTQAEVVKIAGKNEELQLEINKLMVALENERIGKKIARINSGLQTKHATPSAGVNNKCLREELSPPSSGQFPTKSFVPKMKNTCNCEGLKEPELQQVSPVTNMSQQLAAAYCQHPTCRDDTSPPKPDLEVGKGWKNPAWKAFSSGQQANTSTRQASGGAMVMQREIMAGVKQSLCSSFSTQAQQSGKSSLTHVGHPTSAIGVAKVQPTGSGRNHQKSHASMVPTPASSNMLRKEAPIREPALMRRATTMPPSMVPPVTLRPRRPQPCQPSSRVATQQQEHPIQHAQNAKHTKNNHSLTTYPHQSAQQHQRLTKLAGGPISVAAMKPSKH